MLNINKVNNLALLVFKWIPAFAGMTIAVSLTLVVFDDIELQSSL